MANSRDLYITSMELVKYFTPSHFLTFFSWNWITRKLSIFIRPFLIIVKMPPLFCLLQLCGGEKPYINAQVLETEHLRLRDQAVEAFNGARKMGGIEFSQIYLVKLQKVVTLNVGRCGIGRRIMFFLRFRNWMIRIKVT